MNVKVNQGILAATEKVASALSDAQPELEKAEIERRASVIFNDVILLARCAKSKCLITYADAIRLRGHGNPQNGQWLDDVFAYAILPFNFPDLTMLVVNKATQQPSPNAFNARRSILSKILIEDVPLEQKRCIWFQGYEAVLGELSPIPSEWQQGKFLTPEPEKEREIARAVGNAINRISSKGKERTAVGKEYPYSLSRAELTSHVSRLWAKQDGRCALTSYPFELRPVEQGGNQEDRVSLDRIENSIGYAKCNIQLVTQFANRARGTMTIEEAKKRLVQYDRTRDERR